MAGVLKRRIGFVLLLLYLDPIFTIGYDVLVLNSNRITLRHPTPECTNAGAGL